MNCLHCGAPLNYGDKCEYCGSIYPIPIYNPQQIRLNELNQRLQQMKLELALQAQTKSLLDLLNNQYYYKRV